VSVKKVPLSIEFFVGITFLRTPCRGNMVGPGPAVSNLKVMRSNWFESFVREGSVKTSWGPLRNCLAFCPYIGLNRPKFHSRHDLSINPFSAIVQLTKTSNRVSKGESPYLKLTCPKSKSVIGQSSFKVLINFDQRDVKLRRVNRIFHTCMFRNSDSNLFLNL